MWDIFPNNSKICIFEDKLDEISGQRWIPKGSLEIWKDASLRTKMHSLDSFVDLTWGWYLKKDCATELGDTNL